MADERWARISRIYNDAVGLAPADRAAYLRNTCGDDEGLRAEIESLLRDNTRVNALLESKSLAQNPIGQPIGVYQIRSLLGVGGMGEVYRARDTKLGRDVAIKVLPVGVCLAIPSGWRGSNARRAYSRHSIIPISVGIHGFEDAAGVPAFVLELVEGETLADRLAKGRIPVPTRCTLPGRWRRRSKRRTRRASFTAI